MVKSTKTFAWANKNFVGLTKSFAEYNFSALNIMQDIFNMVDFFQIFVVSQGLNALSNKTFYWKCMYKVYLINVSYSAETQ